MNLFYKPIFLCSVSLKWSLSYFINLFKKKGRGPIHIIFCLVDHYEPGTGQAPPKIELKRIAKLLKSYPRIANNHKDYYGNIPKRTWFFPPHYHRNYNLKKLVLLCEKGYGEIELHLHHGKTKPDTAENLRNTILQCIEEYGLFGIFGEQNGKKRYGFIHGDWALDNSRGGRYCGVNSELTVLNETGCYADFTFPSMIETNPSLINKIYYATDDPKKPKSYNSGKIVKRNGRKCGDLMIVQGPLHPFFLTNRPWSFRIFGDAINGSINKKRIDAWIRTNICLKGKDNFIFIKTHTHGATDSESVLGKEIEEIFEYLETMYNDGKDYVLHYVTAREMYNIIKAVEEGGNEDDPAFYRDYKIKPPLYNSSPSISGASAILKNLISNTYNL